jgi:hypothetical protein
MVHACHGVRDNILYFERMCTHESLPPGRSGGGGEHATRHEPDLCGDCAFFDACMRHIKMLCFWYSNIYACITHVHTYVWGTCMQWLSLDTLPRLVIIDDLYIRGPAWTSPSLRPTTRERLLGWILLLLVHVTV